MPVLGWLWLRGKCRACGAPISWRYPAIEAAHRRAVRRCACCDFGADADVWAPLLLVLLLVPITLIDLEHHIIPNVLSAIGAVGAIVAVLAFDSRLAGREPDRRRSRAGGFFLLAAIVYPAGMGMGDVKLAGVLGLFLGRAVAPAIFVALIAGTRDRRASIIARYGAARGPQEGHPVRPLAVLRRPRRPVRRRRPSSTGTSTRSRSEPALGSTAPPGSSRHFALPISGA